MSETSEKHSINILYLHAFVKTFLLHSKTLYTIKYRFHNDFEAAWKCSDYAIWQKLLKKIDVNAFIAKKSRADPHAEWDSFAGTGIKIVQIGSEEYPKLLRQIKYPPPILYCRGKLNNNTLFPLAIVGSRKMSAYGAQALEYIVSGLSGLPISIISGLAYGVDAHAHACALANSLHTVSVLGSGIDPPSIYPRANIGLSENILKNGGAIISEFPPGTKPLQMSFPLRNRIISGISKACLIIEADLKSGALITANFALEQNRDVCAVPGSIFQNLCAGPNSLIKRGAKAITSASDLINEYEELRDYSDKSEKIQTENVSGLTPNQKKILMLITMEPTPLSSVYARAGLPVSEINSCISFLEIKNKVQAMGNNFYCLRLTRTKHAG